MSDNEATMSDVSKKKTSLMAIIDNLRSKPESCLATKGPSMIYLRNISKVPDVMQTVKKGGSDYKKDGGTKEPQPLPSGAKLPAPSITKPLPLSDESRSRKAINTEGSTKSDKLNDPQEDKDTLSNILDFIYQAASQGKDQLDTTHSRKEEIGDVAQLEIQTIGKTGVMILIECLANGTPDVQSIIKNDLDLIYECKLCRGMFRALPNLIRHKKDFCKDNGLYSKFTNQPSTSTETQDSAFKQLLRTLQKPEMTAVPLHLDPMASTSQAVQQKIIKSNKLSSNDKDFNSNHSNIQACTAPPKFSLVDSAEAKVFSQSVGEKLPVVSKMLIKNNGNFSSFSKTTEAFGLGIQSSSTPRSSFAPMIPSSYKRSLCQMKQKPSCPLCNKEMAERKNVRRHLVRVHMLSVVDALKLMHSKNPSVAAARAIAHNDPNENPNSLALRRKCIESLELGNDRKIFVLPPSYEVANAGCPVCSRILCNKTNARRHLLETHNFVIKGDKKYHQLKVYAKYSKTDVATPSLRNLRTISAIPSFGGTDLDETLDESSKFSVGKITLLDDSSKSDIEDRVEPSDEGIKELTDERKEDTDGKVENDNEIVPVEDSIQIDPGTSTCLSCDKSFSRRQTLKNHMITIHDWDKNYFNSIYDKTMMHVKDEVESDADTEEDLTIDANKYSKRNIEPSTDVPLAKKPRMVEVTFKREAIKSIDVKTADKTTLASQKLMAISKLAAAEGGKKFNVGSVSIPFVQSCNNKLSYSSASSTSSAGNKSSVIISRNGPTDSHNDQGRSPKPLILQTRVTLPSATIVSSPSTSSGVVGKLQSRPFIQIKLEQPLKAKNKSMTDVTTMLTEDRISPVFNSRTFNIAEQKCHECRMNFNSQTSLKRHLLDNHSYTIEDVMGASYDSAEVSDEAQENGIALGFNILNAKCLICNQYYFSRENLSRHMSKVHHLLPSELNRLKQAAKFHQVKSPLHKNEKSSSVKNVDTVTSYPTKETTPVLNNDKKTRMMV